MRRSRRSAIARRWAVVWRQVLCIRGHEIGPGRLALFTRISGLHVTRCVECAKADLGMEPPRQDDDPSDFKMRQAGDAS